MKGVVAGKPGQLEYVEFPEPEIGPGEIIIAPEACGICSTDVKMVNKGGVEPRYALGHEVMGRIVAVDPDSTWKIGQRVVASPYVSCGGCFYCLRGQPTLCTDLFANTLSPGGLAERIRIPARLAERGVFAIPDDLPSETAALAEPVGCVIKGLEDSGVRAGTAILIIGDGPMGLLSAGVAKAYGAYPVIVSGMTPHRMDTIKNTFADVVIDVNQADLRSEVERHTEGRGADVVLVAVSTGEALRDGFNAVRPGGVVNSFAGVPEGTTVDLDIHWLHYQQVYLTGSFGVGSEHVDNAIRLLASDRVDLASVITGRFSFDQAPQAVEHAAKQTGFKAMILFN